MAKITINKKSSSSYVRSYVEPQGSTQNGIECRYYVSEVSESWYTTRGFADFNVSNLANYDVKKVLVYREQTTTKGMVFKLSAFISNDEKTPSIAGKMGEYFNTKYKELASIDITETDEQSVVNDITAIFNVSKAVEGIMGIGLLPVESEAGKGRIQVSNIWLEIEYDLIPPGAPTNLSPTTQQNPGLPILFSWQHKSSNANDPQTGWELEISQSGTPTITITRSDITNNYTLPGGSLNNYNNVTYRVRTQTKYNGYGPWASRTLSIGATPPLAPILVFPTNNITVPYAENIIFEWVYNTTINAAQGGFELEMTQDGVSLDTISQTTANQFYAFEADGLIHNYEWRIRTWNEFNEMGAWSIWGNFNTSGKPQAPAILEVTNQNMPLIRWGIYNGLNWRLIIMRDGETVYDTGIQPEILSNEYRLPIFLPDGSYTAILRGISDLNVSSDDSVFNFTLNPEKPEPIIPVIMQNNNYAVHLKLSEADGEKIILRDNVETGRTTGNFYEDYFCSVGVLHEYTVRRVVDYNYSDSRAYHGRVDFLGAFIASVNNPSDFVILDRQMEGQPSKSKESSIGKKKIEVIGRDYGIIEFSNVKNKTVSLSYFIPIEKQADKEKLEEFAQRPELFIIRHGKLGVIKGAINVSADYTDIKGFAVTVKIEQSDI